MNVYEFDDLQFNYSSEPNNSIQFNWCPNNSRCDVSFPSKMYFNPQTISSIYILRHNLVTVLTTHDVQRTSLSRDVSINIQVDFVINTTYWYLIPQKNEIRSYYWTVILAPRCIMALAVIMFIIHSVHHFDRKMGKKIEF